MGKKKVAVLFGGQSSEHSVSCISGATIIKNVDRDFYDVLMIGITEDGRWLLADSIEDIESGRWKESRTSAVVLPDRKMGGVLITDGTDYRIEKIDVFFPVLHGLYGEDGTVQGLFELSGIPYVGCGVLASAAGMDKLSTKKIVSTLNIRQAKYVPIIYTSAFDFEKTADEIEKNLGYPVFVKPSNAGSSKGVSKACDREELKKAVETAAVHDKRILVEEMIIGREVECAVLGGDTIEASGVGEIVSAADFYDFDAKYNNKESKTLIDPPFPEGVREKVRKSAIEIFKALDGFGLSRVDFFVENGTGDVVFNEINTMPGFTSISMYPMLWDACGLDIKTLITKLIEMSEKRNR